MPDDGALVTGRESHQVYLVENGKKRWVPDLWTMQTAGLSPEDLEVVADNEIADMELGDPVPSSVPAPGLEDGSLVETESGVYRVIDGSLRYVVSPQLLAAREGWGAENRPNVLHLPDSLVRSLVSHEEVE